MEDNWSSFNLINFTPSNETLVTKYLFGKAQGQQIFDVPIPDIDLYAHQGLWDKVYSEIKDQNTLYCFTKLKKKTNQGARIDRTAEFGTWKSQSDTEILFKDVMHAGSLQKFTFMVKQGIHMRDRWVMHEYRLDGYFENKKDDYVICRLIKRANKNAAPVNPPTMILTPPNKLGFLPPTPCPKHEINSRIPDKFMADEPDLEHAAPLVTLEHDYQNPTTLKSDEMDFQSLVSLIFNQRVQVIFIYSG